MPMSVAVKRNMTKSGIESVITDFSISFRKRTVGLNIHRLGRLA